MTRYVLPVLLVLLAASSGRGQEVLHPRALRRLHAATWEIPGACCRHAAVAVVDRARQAGLPGAVARYRTRQGTRHVVPWVYVRPESQPWRQGYWAAIESRPRRATGSWLGSSRHTDVARWDDPTWTERVDCSRDLSSFLDLVGETELSRWRRELVDLKLEQIGGP